MNRKILTEQLPVNSLEYLKESVDGKSNVLGKLKGICAEADQPTRNGRVYSRKLWEKVVNSETFNEYITTKTLYGELNHPADRLETDITKVAIALNEVSFNGDGSIVGTFDILDTPSGRILKSLCDYGSKLGVSSRGGGDVTNRDGRDYVDENTYDFVAFDIVALPAVAKARPAVVESVEYTEKVLPLKESVLKEIDTSNNKAHLNSIKTIVESINLPDSDLTLIVESINKKLDNLEGESDTSILLKDLNESIERVQTLEKENASLLEKLSAGTTRESKLEEETNYLKDAMKVLGSKASKVEALEKVSERAKKANTEKISILQEENNKLKDRINLLKEDRSSNSSKVKVLQEQLANTVLNSESELNNLKAKIDADKVLYEQKLKEVKVLTETSNKDTLIKNKTLTEKYNAEQNKVKQLEQEQKRILENYLSLACRYKGLDKRDILNRLGESFTLQHVDKIVEEATDYKLRMGGLPFNLNGVKAVVESKQDPLFENKRSNSFDDDLSGAYELLKHFENKK